MQTIEPSMSAADRRQTPRTKLVDIAYIGMGPENGGLVLDVSEGGLSFHSVAPVQLDEKVQFLLSLRGHSRIEGTGEVVWANTTGTVCGLKFTTLSPGALEHLNNWTSSVEYFRAASVPNPRSRRQNCDARSCRREVIHFENRIAHACFCHYSAGRRNLHASARNRDTRAKPSLLDGCWRAHYRVLRSAAFSYGAARRQSAEAIYNAPPAAATVTDTRPQPTAAPSLPAALNPQNAVASSLGNAVRARRHELPDRHLPRRARSLPGPTKIETVPGPADSLVNTVKAPRPLRFLCHRSC